MAVRHRLAQNVDPNRVTTVCSCGDKLTAVGADDQEAYIVGALGFESVAAGTEWHDAAHARLTWALGLDESPTLMRLTRTSSRRMPATSSSPLRKRWSKRPPGS